MNFLTKLLFILFTICFIFPCCKKEEKYSVIPNIKFENFVWISDTNMIGHPGILTISFTDGDGDIGTYDGATGNSDLFITYFEKQNGKWTDTVKGDHNKDTVMNFNAQIHKITPIGKNKNIKGEIQYKFSVFHYSKFDTIHFQLYIVDRALNKSNIITTPDLLINPF